MIKLTMPPHLKSRLDTAISLFQCSGVKNAEWSLGGGSALEMMMSHRQSEDIDLFVYNPQLTTMLSPRLNSETEGLEYDESSSHLKLFMTDYQIDIICTSCLTGLDDLTMAINGSEINIEHPLEILSKKIFYRTMGFKFRDVFDVMASIDSGLVLKEDIIDLVGSLGNKADVLDSRMKNLSNISADEVDKLIEELSISAKFVDTAKESINRFSILVFKTINEPPSGAAASSSSDVSDIGLR